MNNKNLHDLISLIEEIIVILKSPYTDTTWTHWDTPAEALINFSQILEKLKNNDKTVLKELEIIFLPTGSLQDLSISSGWGDKYIDLSKKFDYLHSNLIKDIL